MKEMDITPMMAGAILREQIGGRYDICFHETRVSGIPFDKSIKQGGKKKPVSLQYDDEGCFQTTSGKVEMEVKMRTGEGQQEEYRVNPMIFANNCYLFVSSKEEIRKMIMDTTEEWWKKGLDWKEGHMELIAWGFE